MVLILVMVLSLVLRAALDGSAIHADARVKALLGE
jgi:hypothetical protein